MNCGSLFGTPGDEMFCADSNMYSPRLDVFAETINFSFSDKDETFIGITPYLFLDILDVFIFGDLVFFVL